jgi:hypothetical protein
MRRTEEVFEQIIQLCRDWGGDILQVSKKDFNLIYREDRTNFFEAPFSSRNLGIDWASKRIIWAEEAICAEILHEMGHLFACSKNPTMSDDYTFFGWEYLLAKRFKIVDLWTKSNRDYCVEYEVGKFSDLGDLTESQKQQVLLNRVEVGQKLGIIVNGSPIPLKIPAYSGKGLYQ